MPSLEVAIEKRVQTVTCIVRCLAVVFHPVIKQGHAWLEVHQSISTAAAWKVTVPGNGVSLESSPEVVVRVRSLSGSTSAAPQP